MANWHEAPWWAYVVLDVPPVALIALTVVRLRASASLPEAANTAQAAREGKRSGIAFGVIFTVEAALIALAAVLLEKAGRPLLIPVAVWAVAGHQAWVGAPVPRRHALRSVLGGRRR
jgi:hypothetical protein